MFQGLLTFQVFNHRIYQKSLVEMNILLLAFRYNMSNLIQRNPLHDV